MKFPIKLEVRYPSNGVDYKSNAPYQGLIRLTERNTDVELVLQDLETGVIVVSIKNESAYKDFKWNTEKVFATTPLVKEI